MPKTYLAFDYGTKRTGLAVGNDLTKTTQPLQAISTKQLKCENGAFIADIIPNIIKTWNIDHLIFGAPLDIDGQATKLSKNIEKVGRNLSKQLNLPVEFIDERYSSGAADQRMRQTQQAGKRFGAKKIALRDSVAAQIILEAYFSTI